MMKEHPGSPADDPEGLVTPPVTGRSSMSELGRRRFPAERNSVPAVRDFVREAVASFGDTWSAELIASELATNAVLHGGSEFEVAVFAGPRIRIEVFDRSRARPTINPAPNARGGYGLLIIDSISEDWGTEDLEEGKAIWAELELPERG